MNNPVKINILKTASTVLFILFSCIFLTNSEAAENLEITFSYYIVRNTSAINKIKLANKAYTKKEEETTLAEREDSKYEYYETIFKICKTVKPVFVRTSKGREKDKIFDFAIANKREVHVFYNTGAIRDGKISVGMRVRYSDRIIHAGSDILVRLNEPFMIIQSRLRRSEDGRAFIKILYLQIKLKEK